MEQRLTEKLLREIRDRAGDGLAAVEILTPLVKEKGTEKDREYLAVMTKSFYRLLRLIRHAEACSVGSISEEKTLDLAGLYRKLGRDGEDMARILGTRFECQPPSDASVISRGDDYLLEMAALNLMVNAFQAAGAAGKVTMTGRLEKGQWLMTVEDDGPGLPTPEAEEDPFLKVHSGVGLGLDTARQVAKLHGGTVMLSLVKGGGVCSALSIPVRKPERMEVRGPEEPGGGFFSALVEFSPLLPEDNFFEDNGK